jgi:hypothetical protein
LAEETGVPRENYQPSKLYILYFLDKVFISEWSLSNHESKGSISIQVLHKKSTQRVINKQVHFICIGSCNSTYHTIMATAASRDRMVVRFTTTYDISIYYHQHCEFESRSWRGVLNTTLCDQVCQ